MICLGIFFCFTFWMQLGHCFGVFNCLYSLLLRCVCEVLSIRTVVINVSPDKSFICYGLFVRRGQAEKEFKVEVEAIGKVRHKNLVGLIGYCAEGAQRYSCLCADEFNYHYYKVSLNKRFHLLPSNSSM